MALSVFHSAIRDLPSDSETLVAMVFNWCEVRSYWLYHMWYRDSSLKTRKLKKNHVDKGVHVCCENVFPLYTVIYENCVCHSLCCCSWRRTSTVHNNTSDVVAFHCSVFQLYQLKENQFSTQGYLWYCGVVLFCCLGTPADGKPVQ